MTKQPKIGVRVPMERAPWTLQDVYSRCDEFGDCQLWRGAATAEGMPRAEILGRAINVRNFVYSLMGKELTKGYVIKPRCENARCVSEHCLTRMTLSQMRKNSSARMRKTPEGLAKHQRKAVAAGIARIGPELAIEIRASEESTDVLAERYGVHRRSIERVRKGETWRTAPVPNSVFALAASMGIA